MRNYWLLATPGLLFCLAIGWTRRANSTQTDENANKAPAAEDRALTFLGREVPRWSIENKCFSCHNNGDGARALYTALKMGSRVPPSAVADTSAWLARPEGWDHNGGDAPFSDKRLARIQFAASLVTSLESGQTKDRRVLMRAAEIVADDQASDGSWPIEDGGAVGSPATYGRPLATYMAREVLRKADSTRFRDSVERANAWLRRLNPKNVLDTAIVLLAEDARDDAEEIAHHQSTLDFLRRAQSENGGWGPYANSPPEPFDTAVVLLALVRLNRQPTTSGMIERGRAYLIATQLPDGSWPGTTRPPGGESYAQRLSTAGWATLALLASRDSISPP